MTEQTKAPRCPECDTPNYNTAVICAACGADLERGASISTGGSRPGGQDPYLVALERMHAELVTIRTAVVFLAAVTAVGLAGGLLLAIAAGS